MTFAGLRFSAWRIACGCRVRIFRATRGPRRRPWLATYSQNSRRRTFGKENGMARYEAVQYRLLPAGRVFVGIGLLLVVAMAWEPAVTAPVLAVWLSIATLQ